MAAGNHVVYVLLECEDGEPTGYVKIGKSTTERVDERVRNLQTGNPRELRRVCTEVVPNAFEVEVLMRQNPKLQRVTGGGTEWFRIPEDAKPYKDFLKHFVEAVKKVRGQ